MKKDGGKKGFLNPISSFYVRQEEKENTPSAQIQSREVRKQGACERLYQRAMKKQEFKILGWQEKKKAMDYN